MESRRSILDGLFSLRNNRALWVSAAQVAIERALRERDELALELKRNEQTR